MNWRLFIDRTAFDPTSQGWIAAYRICSSQSAGRSAAPQKADVHGTPSFSDGCRGAWSLFGSDACDLERAGKPEESTDQEHPRPAGRVRFESLLAAELLAFSMVVALSTLT
jgi:hypothetical protein